MTDRQQPEDQGRQQQPHCRAQQRRPKPTHRLRTGHHRFDEIACLDHDGLPDPLSSLRRFFRPRWVATFRAAIDIPLTVAAWRSDIC